MICKQCNRENWDSSTVCAYCGASLIPDNSAPQPAPDPYAPGYETPVYPGAYEQPTQPIYNNPYTPNYGDPAYAGSYEQPLDPAFAGTGEQPQEPAPKKSKKKLWLTISAIVVSVALVVGLVVYLYITSRPEYKIINALGNTVEALPQSFSGAGTLKDIAQTIYDLEPDDAVGIDISMESNGEGFTASIARDMDEEVMSANISVKTRYDGNYEFAIGATDEKLMVQSDLLGSKVYTIPLEDFGEEFEASDLNKLLKLSGESEVTMISSFLSSLSIDLFADTSLSYFWDNAEVVSDFVSDLELTEVDETLLGAKDLTVYRGTTSLEDIMELYEGYIEYTLTQMLGEDIADDLMSFMDFSDSMYYDSDESLNLYFGIDDDDCLVAVYFCFEEDEEEGFGIRLCGKKNIWDDIRIYEGSEVIGGVEKESTSDGLVWNFYDMDTGDYEEAEKDIVFHIECNDARGTVSFYEDGRYGSEEVFTIRYSKKGDKISFDMEAPDEDVTLSITLVEDPTITLPQGREQSVLDMDMYDFMELAEMFD